MTAILQKQLKKALFCGAVERCETQNIWVVFTFFGCEG